MKVLGLDPSSTRTGYALLELDSAGNVNVAEGGYLEAKRSLEAIHRITVMADDLIGLIEDRHPDQVVVEITSGHVARRVKGRSAGAGLATYGMAVGAIYIAAQMPGTCPVAPIKENVWTRGVSKARRRAAIAARFPAYRDAIARDAGGDVADGIGVAMYWLATLRRGLRADV